MQASLTGWQCADATFHITWPAKCHAMPLNSVLIMQISNSRQLTLQAHAHAQKTNTHTSPYTTAAYIEQLLVQSSYTQAGRNYEITRQAPKTDNERASDSRICVSFQIEKQPHTGPAFSQLTWSVNNHTTQVLTRHPAAMPQHMI